MASILCLELVSQWLENKCHEEEYGEREGERERGGKMDEEVIKIDLQ